MDTVRERRRLQTRQEILSAAWAAARQDGLARLSLRDLARRVGMRAPSLYSYFPSKEAIYDAMFAQGQQEFAEQVAETPRMGSSRDVVRSAAHSFFDFCVKDPVRYLLLFQRTIPEFEPSPESYKLAEQNLGEFIQFMNDCGVTDPRAVDIWTAMLTGLVSQQLSNDPGGDRWGRLLDELVDLYCDHIGL